ncbi:cysteine-rich motor neuron 1 protein-like [Lytechinus variegatus]|uniref:cysteine-rich motor neuron 1 protein-like n=1 Tax=Lytechinus variegatus TaxID=7654 RepID=UPI001BB0E53C|nr:cysteine-rich motor neuron 1 protein-like isoform X1 [Lytechinus variegatus]XP_041472991.1 cysteine-rich motor neuron 1 protein-like [Lytechinus variegatus]
MSYCLSQRIGFNEDILDLKQKDKYFKKREKFKFTNLDFSFSDPMTDCEDMKYICVRIERGDNPRTTGDIVYTLRGYPDSNAQTGCTRAPECRRSQAQGSDSVSSGEGLLPCVYRGLPYLHSEKWAVDECTTCACDNASITCVIETCQPTLCDTPIKPEGICCNICSYSRCYDRWQYL